MGTIGVAQSYRIHQQGAREASYLGIVAGLFILGIQLLLWWVLYKVPEWARGF
jgi:hypothetical protein